MSAFKQVFGIGDQVAVGGIVLVVGQALEVAVKNAQELTVRVLAAGDHGIDVGEAEVSQGHGPVFNKQLVPLGQLHDVVGAGVRLAPSGREEVGVGILREVKLAVDVVFDRLVLDPVLDLAPVDLEQVPALAAQGRQGQEVDGEFVADDGDEVGDVVHPVDHVGLAPLKRDALELEQGIVVNDAGRVQEVEVFFQIADVLVDGGDGKVLFGIQLVEVVADLGDGQGSDPVLGKVAAGIVEKVGQDVVGVEDRLGRQLLGIAAPSGKFVLVGIHVGSFLILLVTTMIINRKGGWGQSHPQQSNKAYPLLQFKSNKKGTATPCQIKN